MIRPEEQAEETLLTNLIEEAGELVQAATKLLRVFHEDTPVSEMEAREHLIEEMADVMLCIQVSAADQRRIYAIMAKKYGRWTARLNKWPVSPDLAAWDYTMCNFCAHVNQNWREEPCLSCIIGTINSWELDPKIRRIFKNENQNHGDNKSI